VILSHAPPCSCKSKEKEKEKKRNINNNLDVLPSHDTRGEQLEWISQNSPLYAALYYVLLFPKRKNRWHPRILICGAQLREQGENARQRDREE